MIVLLQETPASVRLFLVDNKPVASRRKRGSVTFWNNAENYPRNVHIKTFFKATLTKFQTLHFWESKRLQIQDKIYRLSLIKLTLSQNLYSSIFDSIGVGHSRTY